MMRQHFYFVLLITLCTTSPAGSCSRWRSSEKKHQARLAALRTMLAEHVPQDLVELIAQFAHPFLKTYLAASSQRPKKIFFTPDSKKIITICKDNEIRREVVHAWDIYTGRRLCTFTKHRKPISLHATSPDGQLIATVSKEACHVWQLKDGYIKDSITLTSTDKKPIVGFALDERSQILAYALATTPKHVHIRNIKSKQESTLNLEHRVYSLSFNIENELIASIHRGGIQFWDIGTKKRKATIKKGFVKSSPDRTLYAVTKSHTPCPTKLYTASEHRLIQTLGDCDPKCYWQFEFSQDNRRLLTLCHNNLITIWNVQDGTKVMQQERKTPGLIYKTAQFTGDDNVVVLTGERAIFLSNLITRQQTLVGNRQTLAEQKKLCSPDGTIIVCEQRSLDDIKSRQFALHLFDVLHIVHAMESKRTANSKPRLSNKTQSPTARPALPKEKVSRVSSLLSTPSL